MILANKDLETAITNYSMTKKISNTVKRCKTKQKNIISRNKIQYLRNLLYRMKILDTEKKKKDQQLEDTITEVIKSEL